MSTPMQETNGAIARTLTPARRAPMVGQATHIEQSRAMAEVQAAVVVAQQCPRDIEAAIAEMRASCRRPELAKRAFYRYSRGGSPISGASIHLARELARCFRNVQHGLVELSQARGDEEAGQSEMMAYAWDVQTNTRASTTFIVPHIRDAGGKSKLLTDVRDVYENNANMGARRLREQIFSILPPWFVEEAKQLCAQTLEDGGGVPLQKRKADAIALFGDMGVSREQLEAKVGRASTDWTAHDVAQFGVIYQSLQRGEVRVEEEFAPQRVTTDEIAKQSVQPAKRAPRKVTQAVPVDPAAEIDPTIEPGFGEPRG